MKADRDAATPEEIEEFNSLLDGNTPSEHWSERAVKQTDWRELSNIHAELPSLEADLQLGLAAVFRKHESELYNSSFLLDGDERAFMRSIFADAATAFQSVADNLFGPMEVRSADVATQMEHPVNQRLKDLALAARGKSWGTGSPTPDVLMKHIARFRILGWQALAVEVARKGKGRRTQPHPLVEVVKLDKVLRTWAAAMENAKGGLLSAPKYRTTAISAIKKDLWELWSPLLARLKKTSKGQALVPSRSSPIFGALVDLVIMSHLPPRKRARAKGATKSTPEQPKVRAK